MAGFLRKKSTQDGKSSGKTSGQARAARPVTPPPPPLFAKFATSGRGAAENNASQRIVSSPMYLASTRRSQDPPANAVRGLDNRYIREDGKSIREQARNTQSMHADGSAAEFSSRRAISQYTTGPTPQSLDLHPNVPPPTPSVNKPLPAGPDPRTFTQSHDSPSPPTRLEKRQPYTHITSNTHRTVPHGDTQISHPSGASSSARQTLNVQYYSQADFSDPRASTEREGEPSNPRVLSPPKTANSVHGISSPPPVPAKPQRPHASSKQYPQQARHTTQPIPHQDLHSKPIKAGDSETHAGVSRPHFTRTSQSPHAAYPVSSGRGSGTSPKPSSTSAQSSAVLTPQHPPYQELYENFELPTPSSSPDTRRTPSRPPLSVASASPSQPLYYSDNESIAKFSAHRPPASTMGTTASALRDQPSPSKDLGAAFETTSEKPTDISTPPGAAQTPSAPNPPSLPADNNADAYNSYPVRKSSMRSIVAPMRGRPLIFAAMASVGQEDAPYAPPPEPRNDPPYLLYPSPPLESAPKFVAAPQSVPARPNTADSTTHLKTSEYSESAGYLTPQAHPHADLPQPPPSSAEISFSGYYGDIPRSSPTQQLPQPQMSPRPRKLSKSSTSIRSAIEDKSTHHHSSSQSVMSDQPASPRRLLTKKSRPLTPASPSANAPITPLSSSMELNSNAASEYGLPLDDDPFAKVEGVKMLKPMVQEGPPKLSLSRKASMADGDLRPSKDDGVEEPLPNGSHKAVVNSSTGDDSSTSARKPPSPVSPGPTDSKPRTRRRADKPPKVPPPVVASIPKVDLPPRPFPLAEYLAVPSLLSTLLPLLSFYEWCILSSVSKAIRTSLGERRELREEVMERFLMTVGYTRWVWDTPDPLPLSLMDLNDYMRGVSMPTYENARIAESYLEAQAQLSDQVDTLTTTVQELATSARAYTRVVLRLRAQAETEQATQSVQPVQLMRMGGHRIAYPSSPPSRRSASRTSSRAPSPTQSAFSHGHSPVVVGGIRPPSPITSFHSPLYRLRRAPLLRVFVPSPDGDWLSDASVLECEAELRRAGVAKLLRLGDVVWDVAAGDEGNVGRLVWDGSYLIDLDYTYSTIGDLPKYLPTLAFPPSYFHRVIRTDPAASNPIIHIDISPWGEEIAANLQLLQERVRTETPQGAFHNVVRWVHRSSFVIHPSKSAPRTYDQANGRLVQQPPKIPISQSDGLFVDPGWYGTVVVETEGTNEHLADLQDRCGPRAFPPRAGMRPGGVKDQDAKKVFRILRERSRPGEIWMRTVSAKERLL